MDVLGGPIATANEPAGSTNREIVVILGDLNLVRGPHASEFVAIKTRRIRPNSRKRDARCARLTPFFALFLCGQPRHNDQERSFLFPSVSNRSSTNAEFSSQIMEFWSYQNGGRSTLVGLVSHPTMPTPNSSTGLHGPNVRPRLVRHHGRGERDDRSLA